mgnify:CR=1 FL=1
MGERLKGISITIYLVERLLRAQEENGFSLDTIGLKDYIVNGLEKNM